MNTENNSSQALQIFESPQFGRIRTAGTSEQPLFCLADVCKVLELQTGATKARLNEGGISLINTPTQSGEQQMVFINESNLYKVIMRSNKPQAEAFQDWVCGEVLPSIRKNGAYVAAQPDESPELLMARALKAADEAIQRQKQQLQEANQHIAIAEETIEQNERQLKEQAPKVMFADAVSTSKDCILVGDLAKVLTQNGYPIGQNRLFEELRVRGFLCSRDGYRNQPAQRYQEMGLFEIKYGNHQNPDGTSLITRTTKVTAKGLVYFVNYFLNIKKSA